MTGRWLSLPLRINEGLFGVRENEALGGHIARVGNGAAFLIGADGSLAGYAGGLEKNRGLLKLESQAEALPEG